MFKTNRPWLLIFFLQYINLCAMQPGDGDSKFGALRDELESQAQFYRYEAEPLVRGNRLSQHVKAGFEGCIFVAGIFGAMYFFENEDCIWMRTGYLISAASAPLMASASYLFNAHKTPGARLKQIQKRLDLPFEKDKLEPLFLYKQIGSDIKTLQDIRALEPKLVEKACKMEERLLLKFDAAKFELKQLRRGGRQRR